MSVAGILSNRIAAANRPASGGVLICGVGVSPAQAQVRRLHHNPSKLYDTTTAPLNLPEFRALSGLVGNLARSAAIGLSPTTLLRQ
jgi:hypothetical protein